jgi:uncharacterized membrane protein (UPF0182 family)
MSTASRPPNTKQPDVNRSNRAVISRRWIILVISCIVLLNLLTALIAEGFWFKAVDYLNVFRIRLQVQGGLGLFSFGVSAVFLFANLAIARRWAWSRSDHQGEVPPLPGQMGLIGLLPLTLILSLILGTMVVYHGQIAINYWQPNLSLYSANSPVPVNFRLISIWQIVQMVQSQLWQVGVSLSAAIAVLVYPRVLLQAIALLMSIGFGVVLSEQWSKLLLFFSPTPYGKSDPLFSQDIGFYLFRLPVWEILEFWLVGLSIFALISVSLVYLLSGNSLSQGRFLGFSSAQQRHLHGLIGGAMLAIALSYWLERYGLLYSSRGAIYGAGYTNVKAQLPAYTVLSLAALGIGLFALGRAVAWRDRLLQKGSLGNSRPSRFSNGPASNGNGVNGQITTASAKGSASRKRTQSLPAVRKVTLGQQRQNAWDSAETNRYLGLQPQASNKNASGSTDKLSLSWRLTAARSGFQSKNAGAPNPKPIVILLMIYLVSAAIASLILPSAVQRLIVQPNELERERPYIQNSIALTRDAFNLDDIEVETFNPQNALTYADLQDNSLTVNNIRLWDTRPLLETNRQLQRIRLYYEFPDADIDRYPIQTAEGTTEQRQVLIAARELDYSAVPEEAKTWVNQHLIYTHGYGFTVSPVNTAGPGGLPDYFIRGIEHIASSEYIRESIPVGQPRIYYGELTDTYVMTRTRVRELDFPSGSDNVYNTYDGRGGVAIGDYWRRLLFAKHLGDWRMLLTEDFTPETKLLFRRNIVERIKAIAPFLRYDSDPYLVTADVGASRSRGNSNNYLYWFIDAYTTSDHYPYSDPDENDFNYIRNSVKVVVDAYHGSVDFYIADASDPVIQSWSRIFPSMFHPLSEMPEPLRQHIRYPQDFYQVQSNQLMTYHMTDPQVFYNREDKWRAPTEIYADEEQRVEPYYLLMRLPGQEVGEFILLRPYTPAQRRNLIAWLAARSDEERYGTMLLYNFPKQELVYGPEQIEARINQDPVISQQISLWNRQGSRAIQGNLLVIPIEQSLLYVEPLYLEATQNRLPTLVRVIVAYENRIAMAPTLSEALQAIFQTRETTPAPPSTILRPVEEGTVAPLDGILPPDGEN